MEEVEVVVVVEGREWWLRLLRTAGAARRRKGRGREKEGKKKKKIKKVRQKYF